LEEATIVGHVQQAERPGLEDMGSPDKDVSPAPQHAHNGNWPRQEADPTLDAVETDAPATGRERQRSHRRRREDAEGGDSSPADRLDTFRTPGHRQGVARSLEMELKRVEFAKLGDVDDRVMVQAAAQPGFLTTGMK